MNAKFAKLSDKEKEVMNVLWHYNESLTASGITEKSDSLNINTVQNVLKKLVNKNYIEVAEIVYSGTVLSRSYRYLVSPEAYAADQLQAMKKTALSFSVMNFVDYLSQDDSDEILAELEEAIKQKREDE
ncbi:BlaI/MecI/CopY family transcriptional regulator [Filifactor villosus]|uniref:BlaI/MecI/CopY family transcriptional regulator n=1 Tax=Filifactor villosus TaxID=29374 RepID=A0ABV9QMK6_9FIRM